MNYITSVSQWSDWQRTNGRKDARSAISGDLLQPPMYWRRRLNSWKSEQEFISEIEYVSLKLKGEA